MTTDKQPPIRYVKTQYLNVFIVVRFAGLGTEIICNSVYHTMTTGDVMPGPDGRWWKMVFKKHGFIVKGSKTLRLCPEYFMARLPIDFDPEVYALEMCHE